MFFFSLTLTIALPSAANPATPEPAKPVTGKVILAKTSATEVSFAQSNKRVQKFVYKGIGSVPRGYQGVLWPKRS